MTPNLSSRIKKGSKLETFVLTTLIQIFTQPMRSSIFYLWMALFMRDVSAFFAKREREMPYTLGVVS